MPDTAVMILEPAQYHKVRETLGSQRDVAKLLGVDIRTVQRREAGEIMITFEATRALFSLSALNYLRTLSANLAQADPDNGIKRELDDLVILLETQ